jgi:hypothetical protein
MPEQPSKRWRVVLNLVLLGLVGCYIFWFSFRRASHKQPSTTSPPLLEINNYDVGRVLSGEVVSHAFVFTNTSGSTVTIREEKYIKKDCGCAAVEPEARELKPGTSTKIVVAVNTKAAIPAAAKSP